MGDLKKLLNEIENLKIQNGIKKNKENEIKKDLEDMGINISNLDSEIEKIKKEMRESTSELEELEERISSIINDIKKELKNI